MENRNTLTEKQAKELLRTLCGTDEFGKQVFAECVDTLSNVGYPVCEGREGNRKWTFVNVYTTKNLTNHYNAVLRGYE